MLGRKAKVTTTVAKCRFRDTLQGLLECYEHLDDEIDDEEEKKAREALTKLCRRIAQEVFE